MPTLAIGPKDGLYYEHIAPASSTGYTFVFFNALTGGTDNWEAVIAPLLRQAGHGTLAYNMRGQADSPFSPELTLDDTLIVEDAVRLMAEVRPARPILVGLSIGGLFAARSWLAQPHAEALILINTLRQDGPRLKWIGDALVRAVETGGLDLFRDLYLPLLVNEQWLSANRSAFILPDATYPPLASSSGIYKLLAEAGRTSDWDLPYEQLTLPTLVITGLQDHVFLEPDVVQRLFDRMPDARRVDLADAGHLIPAERPEALAQLLIDFAKELTHGTVA